MYKNLSRYIKRQVNRQASPDKKKRERREVSGKLKRAFREKQFVLGEFVGEARGGYRVNIDGFVAFCPYSEMYPKVASLADLENYRGNLLSLVS